MKKILISTGGTGGHVIPALNLYEHLKIDYDIKLYTDSDFRIADIGRSTLATPVGEGLITEFVTQADSAVRFTPGILGYTDSDNVLGVSMQVKNLSGGTAAISVRLKALKLEI